MKVDLEKTRQRFVDTGRMYGPWARAKGLTQVTFRNFMTGRYVPAPGGVVEKRFCDKLAEDGLLVLADEDSDSHAA